jgi:hypothetical protein
MARHKMGRNWLAFSDPAAGLGFNTDRGDKMSRGAASTAARGGRSG